MIPHEHWQPNYGGLFFLGLFAVLFFISIMIIHYLERGWRGKR